MFRTLKTEILRLKMTALWSWQGWCAAWASEKSLRQWSMVNLLSAGLAFMLDLTSVERAMIIGFGMMVLVAELLNTAIENTIDRISQDDHPLSKKAKDAGSAAVAVTAIAAGAVWLVVLIG